MLGKPGLLKRMELRQEKLLEKMEQMGKPVIVHSLEKHFVIGMNQKD